MEEIRGCGIEPPRINLRGLTTDCSVVTCETESVSFCRPHRLDLCEDHLQLHTKKYAKAIDLVHAPVIA